MNSTKCKRSIIDHRLSEESLLECPPNQIRQLVGLQVSNLFTALNDSLMSLRSLVHRSGRPK